MTETLSIPTPTPADPAAPPTNTTQPPAPPVPAGPPILDGVELPSVTWALRDLSREAHSRTPIVSLKAVASERFLDMAKLVGESLLPRLRADVAAAVADNPDYVRHERLQSQLAEADAEVALLAEEVTRLEAEKGRLADSTAADIVSALAEVNGKLTAARMAHATRQREVAEALSHFQDAKVAAIAAVVEAGAKSLQTLQQQLVAEKADLNKAIGEALSPFLVRERALSAASAVLATAGRAEVAAGRGDKLLQMVRDAAPVTPAGAKPAKAVKPRGRTPAVKAAGEE